MTVSADAWSSVAAEQKKVMKKMVERCESDVIGLEALYNKMKVLVKDIVRK